MKRKLIAFLLRLLGEIPSGTVSEDAKTYRIGELEAQVQILTKENEELKEILSHMPSEPAPDFVEEPAAAAEIPAASGSGNTEEAYQKARHHLSQTAFSKFELIAQLEFEGFSEKEALAAIEKCRIDWDQQAIQRAFSYSKYETMSPELILQQLKFEGFTDEEAEFGVNAVLKNYL